MTVAELEALGRYLYGPRWQQPVARALCITPRMVRYWLADAWPIRPKYDAEIAALCRQRNAQRLAREQATYLGLVESLATPALKAAMMAG